MLIKIINIHLKNDLNYDLRVKSQNRFRDLNGLPKVLTLLIKYNEMLRKQIIHAMTVIWESSQLSTWFYNRLYKELSFLSPLSQCHKVYCVVVRPHPCRATLWTAVHNCGLHNFLHISFATLGKRGRDIPNHCHHSKTHICKSP